METTRPLVERLDKSKIKFITVDGIRTRYYEDGAGEPLVLFPGGNYASLYSLDAFTLNFEGLAKRFHVFAIDKLGQGHSDNPLTDADWTFEALLDYTHKLLDALGISNAHLLGHSRGGLLIARLAMDYPGTAKSLICVDTNTLVPEDPRFPSLAFYAELARRRPAGGPTREGVRLEPDASTFHGDHVTDDFIDRMLEIALLPKSLEAVQKFKVLDGTVWLPSLNAAREKIFKDIEMHGFPLPTLVIWGNDDVAAPMQQGLAFWRNLASHTPNAEFHLFNHARHYVFRDHPAKFNRLITSFCLA